MGNLFRPDGKAFQTMEQVVDLIILNLLWIVCSLPLITIGASTAALYKATLALKNAEGNSTACFFSAFKQYFKRAALITILAAVIFAVVGLDFLIIENGAMEGKSVIRYAVYAVFSVSCLILQFCAPLLVNFGGNVFDTIRNATLICLRHFPLSFVILLTNIALPALAILFWETTHFFAFLWVIIGKSLAMYINLSFYRRIFDTYR